MCHVDECFYPFTCILVRCQKDKENKHVWFHHLLLEILGTTAEEEGSLEELFIA